MKTRFKDMSPISWVLTEKWQQVIIGVIVGAASIAYSFSNPELTLPKVFILRIVGLLYLIVGLVLPFITFYNFRFEEDLILDKVSLLKASGKRIILVGAAGSGKDYFRDAILYYGLIKDISYTTRPIREGEINGEDYHFVNRPTFENAKDDGKFYEQVEFNNAYYGTLLKNWNECNVFIMTPSGVNQISDDDRENCIVVYLDIPVNVRINRMHKRSDGGFDKVERRIASDKADFKNFVNYDKVTRDPEFDIKELFKNIVGFY